MKTKEFEKGGRYFDSDGRTCYLEQQLDDGKYLVIREIIHADEADDRLGVDSVGGHDGYYATADFEERLYILGKLYKEPPIAKIEKGVQGLKQKEKELKESIRSLTWEKHKLENRVNNLKGTITSKESSIDWTKEKLEEKEKKLDLLTQDVKKLTQIFYKYISLGEVNFESTGNVIPTLIAEKSIKSMDVLSVLTGECEVKLFPLGLAKKLPENDDFKKVSQYSLFHGGRVYYYQAVSKFLFLSADDEIYSIAVHLQKRSREDKDFSVFMVNDEKVSLNKALKNDD